MIPRRFLNLNYHPSLLLCEWCRWTERHEHGSSLPISDSHLVHSWSHWHQQVDVWWVTSGWQLIA